MRFTTQTDMRTATISATTPAGTRRPRPENPPGTEIARQDIDRRSAAPHHHRDHAPDERVGAVGLDDLRHQAERTASRERPDQGHRKSLRGHADESCHGRENRSENLHRAAGAEDADRHEHRDEIRDDADPDIKTFLRSLYEGFIDFHLLQRAVEDDEEDQRGNREDREDRDDIGERREHSGQLFSPSSCRLKSGSLARSFAVVIPTVIVTAVATMTGPRISVGFAEPAAARIAITVAGMS